ncbi:T9SS type B sorting domain-containing protein [uncultured Polaribacter sp.]|uniref:T9SS type B sorting domain-containing protein n=1 Tax=uncultured Polaribacter sp. TaxID=174711 RepID=UPI0026338E97|nr:T9SS type B sorting domain-containing protein [uncultured Polaribacter sp.]
MKKKVLFFILFISINTFAQKEANYWFFGESAGLNFSTNPPTQITGSLFTDEGSASISDADGVLQFYTDGQSVFNRNGTSMTNGTNLLGDSSSTQSAIIVPKPKDSNIYYVFTVGNQQNGNQGNGVHYSEIDMSLQGGLGEVIVKNIQLTSASDSREKITSVQGEDCDTFWVVTADSNNFYAYKVTENGLSNAAVVSSHSFYQSLRGYLKLSPDGDHLVSANQEGDSYIYEFDNSTGTISNERIFTRIDNAYGVEFSRDSKKLYISSGVHSQVTNAGRNPPDFASIIQINLDSDNNNVIDDINSINNSFTTIYSTNNGYRGALQLASNGKIYYARSRQNFLGVIDSPELDDIEANFIENGISLGSGVSTEGLPPFIQSFFLEVDITDDDTTLQVNNENLELCTGQSKTITPELVTGTTVNYEWTFNNGVTTTVIPSSAPDYKLELEEVTLDETGTYDLKITLDDDCNNTIEFNATFNLVVYETASATTPEDIIFCDNDRDGFNTFDFETLINDEILNGLDSNNFEIVYFKTLVDATSGNTPLPNPYTNSIAFTSETIYARVQNINAPHLCYDITSFNLSITDLPIPTQPEPYRMCDDIESSSDTDGIVNTFILNNKDVEILGNLSSSQYDISYHTTQSGAETNDISTIINKNTNYSVTNSQTVYIRIENIDNTDCYDATTTLDLIVDPLPILKPSPELNQCIEVNDTNTTVNLTLAQQNISDTANVTFEYYENIDGTNLITNITSYPVVVNIPKIVYVKVISEFNCARDLIPLTINVGQTVKNGYNVIQPPVCDDFLDADGNDTVNNSDTDNITNFSLDINAIETGINPPVNTEVFFYENETDRDNSLNEIDITNYRNDINKINITQNSEGIQFPIYYKILSTINNDCQGLGEFYLQINSTPSATITPELELCDDANDGDATNGIVQSFDLESQNTTILNGQSSTNFTVTYHLTASEANTGNNPLSSPFTNTLRDLQTIYVRVTNNTTGCFNDHTTFNLIVNPIPVANFVEDLEICDDNSDGSARNGFSQSIDLESKTNDILGTQDPDIHTVTYHRTLADAQIGNNPLISPYSNIEAYRETIFIRVYKTTTMCSNGISNFDVIINPEPTYDVPTNLAYCDDDFDNDDTNGIIQNIDLDSKISEILGTNQSPNDFNVTFHSSQADATSGDSPIISPYENSNPTETIYVRIQNNRTLCINDDANFNIIVNPLPSFTVTTPQIVCLNDLPLNIFIENTLDSYTYEWTDINNNILSTNDNIDVTTGGNYTITATTTDGTNCSKSEVIVIEESNPAILESSFINIIDESNNIGAEDRLSVFIDTLNNNLGIGDYQYAILNTDNNTRIPSIGFQDEPLFENLEGGIYQVIVNDKNGCTPDTTLLISVIQFPKFFTPNGDGVNDTWVVKGANQTFYPNSSINIFNRFGKIVAQVEIDGQGWDGTYKGKVLPSNDYWYNIVLTPLDTTKPTIYKKGHFSLLRK